MQSSMVATSEIASKSAEAANLKRKVAQVSEKSVGESAETHSLIVLWHVRRLLLQGWGYSKITITKLSKKTKKLPLRVLC